MKKLILLFVGLLFWASGSVGQNLSEGFENEFLVPPDGWTVYYENTSPDPGNLVTHNNVLHYSGTRSFRFSSIVQAPPYGQYLVTPQLNVTEGDQTISFYYSKYAYGVEYFKVGWSSTGNDIVDFTWSDETSCPYGGFKNYEKNDLPIGTKYVAIHYTSIGNEYLYIDQVTGPALHVSNDPPNGAVNISPANSAIDVPITAFLNWRSGGGAPTGYKLYFGTDGGGTSTPVNLENGTVQIAPYTPIFSLNYSTTYYWQVVPFNAIGDAVECPIWSFTTKADPTISTFPHTENFDGLWAGTPEAPEGWTILNPDNDTYFWKQSFENINPPHSSPYAAQGSGNTSDYLITPPIDLIGTNARIKWWDKVESAEYVNPYKVMVSATPSDISSFIEIANGTFQCANEEWTAHELDLIAYEGQKIYVAFYQFASPSPLWGFGIDDVTIEEIPDNPVFTASPEAIRFGGVNLGETSVQSFTISNMGMEPFKITGIALGGIDVDQFALSDLNSYPIELGYRNSITVDVTFDPTIAGAKTALLTISDNQGGGNHLVNITGNPLGATCSNPLLLPFPAYAIEGNTADYGNDYSSEDIGIENDIHANYMNGYDVVYQFTLEDGGYLGGTILSKVYHIGAFIFEDCPNSVNPPEPLYYDVNNDLKMANFWYDYIPAGTYYLIITSWAEPYESEIPEYKIYLNFHETKPPDQSIFMGDGFWSDIHSWTFSGKGKDTDAQPGYVTDVVIDGDIIVDGDYACQNLTIGPNGSITFLEGSKLNIIKLPTIKSDNTGTGSFIAKDDNYIIGENSDYENEVNIKRYLTGGWDYDNTGWHQISSPVKNQGIDAFHAFSWDYDFYAWGETENLWLNYFDEGWTGGENFNLGQGYLISYPEAENWKEFTGQLNNNSVTKTDLSKNGGGWHLLGNPFASALKWNETDGQWALNNVGGLAKIWNEAGKTYSDIAANGIIPSAQGFMVQVNSETNSITIPAASRVHDATPYYKSTNEQLLLVAAETEGGSAQESKIMVNSMATEGFDFEFDSRFLAGYGPLLYSVVGDEMLSTNSLPSIDAGLVIPFGFVKNAATNFTIELKESIPDRVVYLTDNKTSVVTNLTETSVYSFTSDEGDDANRFLLAFGTLGINNPEAADGVQVYAYGDVLYVATSTKETALVNVYNLTGQLVMQGKTGGNALTTINASALNNGIYVVNIILNEGVVSRKVVIRK
jgi:hypothetical protein